MCKCILTKIWSSKTDLLIQEWTWFCKATFIPIWVHEKKKSASRLPLQSAAWNSAWKTDPDHYNSQEQLKTSKSFCRVLQIQGKVPHPIKERKKRTEKRGEKKKRGGKKRKRKGKRQREKKRGKGKIRREKKIKIREKNIDACCCQDNNFLLPVRTYF